MLLRNVLIGVSIFVFPTFSMFLEAIQESLDCSNNDEEALFAICLLCAAICNDGMWILSVNHFTITGQNLARSLANFYRQ